MVSAADLVFKRTSATISLVQCMRYQLSQTFSQRTESSLSNHLVVASSHVTADR